MQRNMEDMMQFHKVLHLLINQFITEFKKNIELKEIDKDKVYIELLKRRLSISQEIVTVASTFLASYETAAVPIPEEVILKKISDLVENSLQQDLIECALTAEEDVTIKVHISKDDLHNILYKCCVDSKFSVVPSPMHLLAGCSSENEDLSIGYFQIPVLNKYATAETKEASRPLSKEFENACHMFGNELLQLKHSAGIGVSSMDLKFCDLCPATGDSHSGSLDENLASAHIEDWLHSVVQSNNGCNGVNDIGMAFPPKAPFLSWESCVRQPAVPCHLYTSELTGTEVQLNVIDEDPHVFRTIHDPSGVISEYDFIHDVLDLLVGIPSNTFLFNKIQKKFQLKSLSRLFNLSHESTLRFSDTFIEAGTMFYKLKTFCTEYIQSAEGLVLKGLKNGISEILSVYMEYNASVKMNKPTMLMLRKDISENAELIRTLGVVCGLSGSGNTIISLPKGLGLLSFLNKISWSYKSKGNAIMVAVLLKFAYSPYFEFLNQWMTAGVCCDPYNEFQISEDIRYLDRKDDLYWKFAYTSIKNDDSRTVPPELEKYSHDILQCGKSMRLLQKCCPQLFSLEYMFCNPPPCFSMVFSYHAVNVKREECASYVLQKEMYEFKQKSSELVLTEDDFLIEKQSAVERRVILAQIQRKWNQSYKIPDIFKERASTIPNWNKNEIRQRCQSFPNLAASTDVTTFSGIVHETSGLLFGSCFRGDSNLSGIDKEGSEKNSAPDSWKSFYPAESRIIPYPAEDVQGDRFKKCGPTSVSASKSKQDGKQANIRSPDRALPLGSFVNSLASLLLSDYGDTKEDICSCLNLTSLQNLMQYNFSAVMNMRMHLVQKTIVYYIINELGLKKLLICLKNTYFLQDECFSQSLGKRLFNWAMKCDSLNEFADWSILNEMLTKAVAVPSFVNISFLETASANFVTLPEEYIFKRNKFMQYFNFEFKIDRPLNIIIHKDCITHYSRIMSFILEIEFLCWLLAKIWRSLLISANENKLENSPQYRKLMLNRFDMHQFIQVVRNCIHQDLGGPLWDSLEKSLRTEEIGIDALQEMHGQYLERALARCFLTEETAHLHNVLEFLFEQVEMFCRSAMDCTWKLNPDTGHFESSEFENWSDSYSKYQTLKETFYERITKMVRRKKLQRLYNEHYQLYLETILETSRKM